MKKIYTLIAVVSAAMTANAQYDVSIAWNAMSEGDVVTTIDFEGGFTMTNEGATIVAGDSLIFGYLIDGAYFSMAFTPGASFTELTEDWLTGETLSYDNAVVVTPPLEAELCAVVHGVGIASQETMLGDENVEDNSSCVDISVEEDDSNIEELGLTLTNVYVAGNQLMMVNEGVNGESLVNVSIVNMNGQTVQSSSLVMVQGTSSIAINNLASGIYVVAIEVEGETATRKISIQ